LHIRWQHARVRANFKALTDNLLKCARVLQWMPLADVARIQVIGDECGQGNQQAKIFSAQ
jgi:hypothetical protein